MSYQIEEGELIDTSDTKYKYRGREREREIYIVYPLNISIIINLYINPIDDRHQERVT